jgi:tRNA G18 (ribose-2'-O)-methylase SpoU
MIPISIEDIRDERLDVYRNIRSNRSALLVENRTICEGKILLEQAILTGANIQSILLSKDMFDIFREQLSTETVIYIAEKDIIDEVAGYKLRKSILFDLSFSYSFLKEDELPEQLIFLNGIINFENVGSIIRNATAFGFKDIIFDSKTCSPFYPRSIVVSRGSVFHSKIYKCIDSGMATLHFLKELGYDIISIEINKDSKSIIESLGNLRNRNVIVFGSEGEGVDQTILDLSDKVLHIPMDTSINSINVAASSAIALFLLSKSVNL